MAAVYFGTLIEHPPQLPGLHAVSFFTEATCLFPTANVFAIEYRLEAWSCGHRRWEPLDPRAYFPIEADDKESRFQRLGHFYDRNRIAMHALDDYIVARHSGEQIGGIRLYKWIRPIPEPGAAVERYVYRPLAPVPPKERRDMYWTLGKQRDARCGS